MQKPTHEDVQGWVAKVHAMREEYRRRVYPNLPAEPLTVEFGRKNARIVVNREGGGRSCFCFVDLTNGDILKAASWKAPAKHARGNIFAEKPLEGVTPYGAAYL